MNFGKYFFNRHYFLAGFFILVVFSYFFVFLPIDFPLHTLASFDEEEFIKKAKDKEGYLFPDTYHFPQNIKPNAVIEAMEKNFNDKIIALNEKISAFGKPLKEVMVMASLLEEEARKLETKQMIAGILWKRLKMDMPLQVDASFQYVNGKNSFTLTTEDLATDSP